MPDNHFEIRDYKNSDYPDIVRLWKETDLGGEHRGDTSEIIEQSIRLGGKLLVMTDVSTGILMGTSWMTFDGRRIHLHHFGIQPEYQGRGLSKKLVKASLLFAKEKGYQIKLEVHQTNHKAIRLYKNSGFKYLGDYDVYIIRDFHEEKKL
jgi:[ribosomal protein S18]-alanine N-acetyltransferase